jgi:phage major head subunit gpT-like protein
MISGDVPTFLLAAARTGFLTTADPKVPAYTEIASTFNMDGKTGNIVDLGAAPMPQRSVGGPRFGDFIEKALKNVEPLDWEIPVGISYNAVKDDRTGTLEQKARSAGENFQLHLAQLCFKALNDGEATTNFGAGYDGLSFFNDSHVDKGANYTTAQDNKLATVLSLANFTAARGAAMKFRNDQGMFPEYNYNLLVVPPELETLAWQITTVRGGSDDSTKGNPFAGNTKYMVTTQFDATAWVLVAGGLSIKPIIVVLREAPNLQSAWFDPKAPDGGMFYFKFYARYNHVYGDWRTAILGNT